MPTRRDVLRGLAGVSGLLALEACGTSRSAPPAPASNGPSATPSGPADWESLRRRLSGTLRLPTDPGYDAARQLFDRRYDAVHPAAVASVGSADDAAACVSFARSAGVPLTVRSGGHSYLGGSTGTGLVVDLRPLSAVTVAGGTATIGAGAQLVDVYARLADAGRALPAGSCPSVGIGGLLLGGGQGVLSRSYGLTCDRLVSAEVVLADGRTVIASTSSEPDLFWALRGGGGSFGLVTSVTVTTVAAPALSTSFHAFHWADAASVLAAWTAWIASADRAVWSTCHLLAQTATPSGPPALSISCVRVGSSAGLRSALQPLLAALPAPTSASYRDRSLLDTMLLEADCAGKTVAACHLDGQAPGGTVPREVFVAGSAFFTAPLSAAAAAGVAAAVEQRQAAGLGIGGVAYDSWGGAIAEPASDATAFPHRSTVFGAQVTAAWDDPSDDGAQTANEGSRAALLAAALVGSAGGAYSNYADASLADAPTQYWGANLARLRRVKRTYDPANVFAPPQGVLPA